VITLGELEIWLVMQITGAYHPNFHRGLGSTPIDAWNGSCARTQTRHPRDPERFYIDFLPFERRMIRRDGIQLLRIHYWDNALSVLAARSERKVLVRYDPHDLSRVFIKDVGTDDYLVVPYRDLNYPPITLMEHRAALKRLAKRKLQAITENSVFSTIAAQRVLIEKARRKTVAVRRMTQQQRDSSLASPSAYQVQPMADDATVSSEPVQPYAVEVWG
jgi:putative transposase